MQGGMGRQVGKEISKDEGGVSKLRDEASAR